MVQSIILYSLVFLISMFTAWMYQKSDYSEQHFFDRASKKANFGKLLFILMIILPPVLISTIRKGIGTDYWGYLSIFRIVQTLDFTEIFTSGFEPLYFILNYIVGIFNKNGFWIVMLLSSFLMHLFVVLTLDYYGKDVSMPLGLFVFYMLFFPYTLNIVRQMIAVTIVLYAYRFIIERKYYKYFLFVLLASLFHSTALVCIVFVFFNFNTLKMNRVQQLILLLIVLLSPLIILLSLNIASSLPVVGQYFSTYSLSFKGYGVGFLIDLSPLLLPLLFYRKEIIKENSLNIFYINLAIFCIPLRLIAYHQIWAYRLVFYITVSLVLVIPKILGHIKKKRLINKDVLWLTSMFLMYYIYYFILQNYGETFPYHSIFGFI